MISRGFLQLLPLLVHLFYYGICSLLDTTFNGAVDTALVDKKCYGLESPNACMTCVVNKALVNVGDELSKLVLDRVSTEVDAHLAYHTHAVAEKLLPGCSCCSGGCFCYSNICRPP